MCSCFVFCFGMFLASRFCILCILHLQVVELWTGSIVFTEQRALRAIEASAKTPTAMARGLLGAVFARRAELLTCSIKGQKARGRYTNPTCSGHHSMLQELMPVCVRNFFLLMCTSYMKDAPRFGHRVDDNKVTVFQQLVNNIFSERCGMPATHVLCTQ